jgi:hypothetical protein
MFFDRMSSAAEMAAGVHDKNGIEPARDVPSQARLDSHFFIRFPRSIRYIRARIHSPKGHTNAQARPQSSSMLALWDLAGSGALGVSAVVGGRAALP